MSDEPEEETKPLKKKVAPKKPGSDRPLTPGQRWMKTLVPPTPPNYLSLITMGTKREDKTGVLWKRELWGNTWYPDTENPATLGVLTSVVREVWSGRGYVTVEHPIAASLGEPWRVKITSGFGDPVAGFQGTSEGEALVRALEESPPK